MASMVFAEPRSLDVWTAICACVCMCVCVFVCFSVQRTFRSDRLFDLPDVAGGPSALHLETPGEVSPAAD
jgi:hypothetical protein